MLREEREALRRQARGVADRVHRRITSKGSDGSRDRVRERRTTFSTAAILLFALCANMMAPRSTVPTSTLSDASAGPVEAKERLEHAKAFSIGKHWLVQADAYQDVARMTNRSDPTRQGALKAMARSYRKGGRAHGALAALRHVASYGPKRDASRLRALLAYASALRAEHDLDAARAVAEAVASLSGSVEPAITAKALALLADDAHERGAAQRLEALLRAMDEVDAPADTRIRLLGRLGELYLGREDVSAARKALLRAKTLYQEIAKQDNQAARKATKVWMDLPLRKQL